MAPDGAAASSGMADYPKFKACTAHVAPVFLDAGATVAKACSLIAEAAGRGARLIAFPESYVPGFPVWAAVQAPIHNHEFFKRFARHSLSVPGPEVEALCEAAGRNEIFVSIGISERSPVSVGALWNTNLLIGTDGTILNHHRKLVPTFYEKLIWAPGDGAGLHVCDTPVGKLGMLICGENTNPLARYSLIAQGEQVHVSSYPPVWPTRPSNEPGRYDLASAIRIRAGAHSDDQLNSVPSIPHAVENDSEFSRDSAFSLRSPLRFASRMPQARRDLNSSEKRRRHAVPLITSSRQRTPFPAQAYG